MESLKKDVGFSQLSEILSLYMFVVWFLCVLFGWLENFIEKNSVDLFVFFGIQDLTELVLIQLFYYNFIFWFLI